MRGSEPDAATESGAVARVAALADRLRRWLTTEALPFWADVGVDSQRGGFVEHLTLNGEPAPVDFKRVRVQARQLYVFSYAARSGWMPQAARVARQGSEFLMRNGWDAGRQVWLRSLTPDGRPLDRTVDLYDNAFAVFALAHFYRLAGDPRLLRRMEHTVAGVRATLAHPTGRGYWPAEDQRDRSLQNHNMHWFEAMLEAWSVSGRDIFRDEALAAADLFQRHLFDPTSGTLAEIFDARWQRVARDGAIPIEPGHHYEWSVLLTQYTALGGKPAREAVPGLLAFADRAGVGNGLIWDEVSSAGQVLKRSHRLWPQTEAVRAWLVRPMDDEAVRARFLEPLLTNLLERYFARTPRGTWNETLDAAFKPVADKIPSSSLYHVVTAMAELLGRHQPETTAAAARR
jgi:mannose/cellobiose epimerase-like protein (N-acyl-D-glucosamine 2-epimerase family)